MSSSVDAAVLMTAVPQCGAFSLRQLLECGGSYRLARRRIAAGIWTEAPGRVVQLPGFPLTFPQRLWWAVLAAPPGAYVSHWSAAALVGISAFPRTRLMITVPHGHHHESVVAQVFQTRTMPLRLERIHGLPVSPLARALIDCGRLVGPRRLGAAVDEADGAGRCSIAAVQKEFLRLAAPGRNGISTMRSVLEERSEVGYVPPRVTLERHLDRVLDRLPVTFEKEAPLPGREWSKERVDRLVRSPRAVVVEGDGRRYHTRVADFARDARRRRDAAAAGFVTLNYLYEELRDDPDAVEAELLEILGFRSG